jgi:hypothetical protein
MVLSATFNNVSVISWLSVLLVEETGVPGENNRPVASHRQLNAIYNKEETLTCQLRKFIFVCLIDYFSTCTFPILERHGRDRMVVGFTTTCARSAYYH